LMVKLTQLLPLPSVSCSAEINLPLYFFTIFISSQFKGNLL
jgi:hypothetical protein